MSRLNRLPGRTHCQPRVQTMPSALLIAIVLGIASGCETTTLGSGLAQRLTVQDRLSLQEGPVTLLIRADQNKRDWVSYLDQRARTYLAAAEEYLNLPFARTAARFFRNVPYSEKDRILLSGAERVYLNGQWYGGYNNTAGFTKGERGIFLEYRISRIGDPALPLHELGHFWIDGIPWLSEGMVSYLPLAMAESGCYQLTPEERRSVRRHFGLGDLNHREDAPVEIDLRPRGNKWLGFFYAKTFKVQHILYHELGPADYRRFAQEVARVHGRFRNNEAVIELLGSIKPAPWREILSGWVFAGPYLKYNWNFFRGATAQRPW